VWHFCRSNSISNIASAEYQGPTNCAFKEPSSGKGTYVTSVTFI
jgi:hypothetical protein